MLFSNNGEPGGCSIIAAEYNNSIVRSAPEKTILFLLATCQGNIGPGTTKLVEFTNHERPDSITINLEILAGPNTSALQLVSIDCRPDNSKEVFQATRTIREIGQRLDELVANGWVLTTGASGTSLQVVCPVSGQVQMTHRVSMMPLLFAPGNVKLLQPNLLLQELQAVADTPQQTSGTSVPAPDSPASRWLHHHGYPWQVLHEEQDWAVVQQRQTNKICTVLLHQQGDDRDTYGIQGGMEETSALTFHCGDQEPPELTWLPIAVQTSKQSLTSGIWQQPLQQMIGLLQTGEIIRREQHNNLHGWRFPSPTASETSSVVCSPSFRKLNKIVSRQHKQIARREKRIRNDKKFMEAMDQMETRRMRPDPNAIATPAIQATLQIAQEVQQEQQQMQTLSDTPSGQLPRQP